MTRQFFEQILDEIDRELNRKGVEIFARPLKAALEFGRRLNIDFSLGLDPAAEDDFSPSALGFQIHSWYERRYGERLKRHMGPGSIAVMLRDEAWEVRLPLFYGRNELVADRDLERYIGGGKYNVLRAIQKLPASLARDLIDEELHGLLVAFVHGLEVLQALAGQCDKPYVREALHDLDSAVKSLVEEHPHYGMSKWDSLQCAEKLIKSLLTQRGVAFPHSHKLAELADLVRVNTGITLHPTMLRDIQCPASVRYGEVQVTKLEAATAHCASLAVAAALLPPEALAFEVEVKVASEAAR